MKRIFLLSTCVKSREFMLTAMNVTKTGTSKIWQGHVRKDKGNGEAVTEH